MKKLMFKFSLSLVLLINTIIFVVFFYDYIDIVEPFLFPLFFLYFIVDSFEVILPVFNRSIYSSKMQKRTYIEVEEYDINSVKHLAKEDNKQATIIFVLYSALIISIGLMFLYIDILGAWFIYLTFFALNFSDYFCIMIWCPFRSWFLKNSCCNTCRISNWDRIMKFSILIFIPNIYTITIFAIGSLIFLYWEYQHFVHPERFYRVSNKLLWCSNCDKITCGKKAKQKEQPR